MLRLDGVYVTTSRFWEIISDFLSVEWLEMRPFNTFLNSVYNTSLQLHLNLHKNGRRQRAELL